MSVSFLFNTDYDKNLVRRTKRKQQDKKKWAIEEEKMKKLQEKYLSKLKKN